MTLLAPAPVDSTDASFSDPSPSLGWRPRSDADLLLAQLRALDLWHTVVGHPEPSRPGQSREARLDDARRRDVAERERDALYAWADAAQRDQDVLGRGAMPRAVVAHRNEWLRDKLSAGLVAHGVEVVASVADGAVAAAAVVMEQPDLVFIEDLLPSLTGLELIRRTRTLAPDAVIGAHALGPSGMPPLVDAGARAAFSRRIPPAEIAAELVACLHGRHAVLTLV